MATNLIGQSSEPGVAGVLGESSTFNGALGQTTADGHAGVAGVCDEGNGNGVYGRSKNRNGVYGVSSAAEHSGVVGQNDNGTGVLGRSTNSVGVWGLSDTREGVIAQTRSATTAALVAYQSNPSSHTAALYAKHDGKLTAAVFEGDVDITGNLNVRGISFQALIQRIQQLEQKVAVLGSGSGGTTQQANVLAGIELAGGIKVLRIRGSNFRPGEGVSLRITTKVGTNNPFTQTLQTTADSTGSIDFKFGGSSGGLCLGGATNPTTFQVQGTGLTSSKVSNVANAGC